MVLDLGYQIARDAYATGLPEDRISDARNVLDNSERFSVDETGHILLRQTGMPVGFIGKDSLELCFPENVDWSGMRNLRKAHSFLMSIYSILL